MRVLIALLVSFSAIYLLVPNAISHENIVKGGQTTDSDIRKISSESHKTHESVSSTISQLVAQNLDLNFQQLAASIKALGEEYVCLYKITPSMGRAEQQKWLDRRVRLKETTAFYPQGQKDQLAYQSPFPAYFSYRKDNYTPDMWHELNTFVSLYPMFRIAYKTFNDSWVYLTTVNGVFLIYPYLPLNEAINNYPPTKQVFYTAADFKNRTFGWTAPYLDLAGAGMMVTVAYPIYDKEKLLGVISRDITLDQFTSQQLKPVAESGSIFCLVVDKNGLAIANSTAAGADEIKEVNKKAGTPILYYRTRDGMSSLKQVKAKASSREIAGLATEGILGVVSNRQKAKIWNYGFRVKNQQYRVSASRMSTTGWLVMTVEIK